jgi:pimeloyl-ACP methyl ester carboxylesterase
MNPIVSVLALFTLTLPAAPSRSLNVAPSPPAAAAAPPAQFAPSPLQPEVRRVALALGDTVIATSFNATTVNAAAPVILVPGLLGGSYTFRNLATALTDAGYHVVIIEPLGMGASARPRDADYSLEAQAARVGHTLDTLDISSATFVCHSVGASICMRLSLQRPALTRAIISINGGPDEAAGTAGLKSALRMAPLLKLFGAQRIIRGKVKDGLRDSSANPSWVTDAVVSGYTASFANFNAALTAFRGMVNARERAALRPRLHEISAPFTLLVGAGNPKASVTSEDLQLMRQSIRNMVVDSVAGAGQYIQEEKPAAVVEAVREIGRRK